MAVKIVVNKKLLCRLYHYYTEINFVVLFRKMKKLALILLTAVYMLSTVGVAVSQFYCCSELKSVNFSLSNAEYKTCTNDTKDDGCCKTTHQYLKVKDSHVSADVVSFPEKYFSILHTGFPVYGFIAPEKQQAAAANNINAPPLLSGTPIYIFNCTYRI